ncbi:16S rRNA (adenine(1518)-N(6)/adenine(1519)-N(6))-dimethyltransferase RsmA [Fretibacter rubidus]|uniref:16S rRNA (adenine(1518)-N(6)/adenine(1519)-N(6))- dimethyltransferase RsmA n=1 Tax=Fretibacter rubidus TaxID=570162 RepID=UPI00352BA437
MLDNLPTLSEVVKLHGLDANKKLGQHFLLDSNITDKIAKLTTPLEGVTVVEIGPGPGGLTRSLFKIGAERVLAIEMDARFLPALSDIGDASGKELRVINDDGLKVDIAQHSSGEVKIAANLPYNVGTKMLTNWLTADPLFWTRAVLMFQKEVAERVVAGVGDKAYGRLAILSQSVCQTHLAFVVPARAFSPPPKVDSAVVVLDVLPAPYKHLKELGQLTAAAFGQRRKMLRRSLKTFGKKHGLEPEPWCEACGIDPTKRPEDLPVSDFHALTDYLITHRQSAP